MERWSLSTSGRSGRLDQIASALDYMHTGNKFRLLSYTIIIICCLEIRYYIGYMSGIVAAESQI
ncbi:hypothetical protein DPMN_009803 [Dreissena polymorpha]|uniref:Uncharacterized protein n=1 Tax=Dreissena polymorpha TaxID=45954 RepID=A0A9D4N0Z4_DREPO|nr:hypothetical protein DPMN_009803 [Dreissena polymorpha]